MAVAIRRPANRDAVGNPDRAIIRIGLPVAIAIEIVVAVHVARNVARRRRTIFALVLRLAPVFEVVEFRRGLRVERQLIRAVENILLPGREVVGFPRAGHLARAFAHR